VFRPASAAVTGACAFALLAAAAPAAVAATSHQLSPNTRFALRQPDPAALQQVAQLVRSHDLAGAAAIAGELITPQATWLTKGTPQEVAKTVRQTVALAGALRTVPVLVVYNVPGRDCSQYSSGGAGSDTAYTAWIDGVVKGLGSAKAVVVVEPDGLANLPSDCPAAYPGQDVAALTAGRIADVKYAGETIEASDPSSSVYLDAGNSAWHSAGDIANRLYQAGVGDVQGFSLNVSNYQYTVNSDFYGTWVSDCLAYATPLNSTGVAVNAGDFGDCGDEYYNGGPATGWAGGSMNRYAPWSAGNPDLTLNTDGVTSRYAVELGTVTPTAHFVVDTGRNGTGPNDMSAYAAAPYNQPPAVITGLQNGNWCNSPGARLGVRPTANTGVPLADAYLWVKTVGESDGQCNIAGGARAWDYTAYNPWGWDATAQQQNDPLWGIQDPAAGDWFGAEALQLAGH
jgi:endoglucanase